jgi:signal recognition particle subunit SRP54
MLSLLPGVPKDLKQASSAIDDRQIGQIEAIIRSMTPSERAEPTIIDGARRVRIARGSGTATSDVNALLKQFKEMQKMMKGIGKGGMPGGFGGLFGRGTKMSPRAMAEMAQMAEMGGVGGDPSVPALAADPAAVLGSGGSAMGGPRHAPKAKGRGGKKGKGGGRVTPKAR